MFIPPGNSGTFIDARTDGCPYKLEDYTSAAVLSRFAFLGDSSTLTTKGMYYQDRGFATFGGGTTLKVMFSKTQPDTNYVVTLAPSANIPVWWASKTTTGFTVLTTAASRDWVDWSVSR